MSDGKALLAACALLVLGGDREEQLRAGIESIRAKAKVPALGGALVTADGEVETVCAGVRAAGRAEFVGEGDRWHIGSCTKSMTATLIALLVERGDLEWKATLPELLPDLEDEIHPGYHDVTLLELLTNRAGVPADLSREGLWNRCWERKGTPTEQRRMLAKSVLGWGPVHEPRGAFLYSNAGFAIAGHVAETAAGEPYETLMQELLFEPLGITSAGFGAPGAADERGAVGGRGARDESGARERPDPVDQPRGHDPAGAPIAPGPFADNPPAIAPAGTVHLSLADWAKYVALHLRGAKGEVKVGKLTLGADAMAKLHEPFDAPGNRYAMGWLVTDRPWAGGDGLVWTHNGSNTMWFAVAWLAPRSGFAVLATCNAGGPKAERAVDEVAELLIREHGERSRAKQEAEAE